MKKWRSVICGSLVGAAVGVFFVFQKVEMIPHFIHGSVLTISGFLQRLLLPGTDPMAAFFFLIPVMILFCAMIGVLVAIAIDLFVVAVKRRRNL
jgi:hypothetical protein